MIRLVSFFLLPGIVHSRANELLKYPRRTCPVFISSKHLELLYLDALFQELQGQVRLVLGQGFADRLDEDGVVGRNADAVGLQQVALDLEVEGGRERAEEVVSRRSEVGVGRAQVQQRHVQKGSLLKLEARVECFYSMGATKKVLNL